MPSEKNHYIPKFYTRQWCGPDGKLCQYAKYGNRVAVKRHPSEGVGFKYNLYTVEGVPEHISSHMEDIFLKSTDQHASNALDFLLDDRISKMDIELRTGWTRFILTLLQRNPEKVYWIKRVWAALYSEAWSETIAALESRGEFERANKLRSSSNESHQLATGVKNLQQLMDLEKTGTHILNMEWDVLLLRTHKRLLTSDRPVIMSNGLNKKESHIALPISKELLFVAANERAMIQSLADAGAKQLSQMTNDLVTRQSKQYVYGHDDSQFDFVAKRIGERPQFICSDEMRKRFPPEDN